MTERSGDCRGKEGERERERERERARENKVIERREGNE